MIPDAMAQNTAGCRMNPACEALYVEILGIDYNGFDVRADARLLRFYFTQRVLDAQQAREALVAMSRAN
jgi:heme oxygenase (biliverdin-IX-beta and delta-forming)